MRRDRGGRVVSDRIWIIYGLALVGAAAIVAVLAGVRP